MKRRVIYIYHTDEGYKRAMAGRLALLLSGAEIRAAGKDELKDPAKEVFIMDRFASAECTAARIAEEFHVRKKKNAGVCKATGFTSGCGGTGTSTTAVLYGKVLSQFYGLRVLYLSLDRLAQKCGPFRTRGIEDPFSLLEKGKSEDDMKNSFGRDVTGMYYAATDEEINQYSCLDESELEKLLSVLEDLFDRIVLDIPVNAAAAPGARIYAIR